MLWGVTCHGIPVALGEVIVKTSRLLRLMMVWAWLVEASAGLALALLSWTSGTGIQDLGTLAGGVTSIANALNESLVIVGESDGANTGR
jgi:hypothetical protein